MLTSPVFDEVRARTRQQDTVEVLQTRFPGQVPPALVERIQAEKDLNALGRLHKLAITATLDDFQKAVGG